MRSAGPLRTLSAALGVAALSVACAQANPCVPSLSRLLVEDRFDNKFYDVTYGPVFDSPVLIPILLLVALIETLAIRSCFKSRSFGSVFRSLLWINLVTTLIGYLMVPLRCTVWVAVGVGFVSAVALEGLLVFWDMSDTVGSFGRAMRISVRMNTASYLVIALFVGSMIYIPAIGTEDRSLLTELSGTIYSLEDRPGTSRSDSWICATTIVDARTRRWHSSNGWDHMPRGGWLYYAGRFRLTWVKSGPRVSPDVVDGISADGRLRVLRYRPPGTWGPKAMRIRVTDQSGKAVFETKGSLSFAVFSTDDRYCAGFGDDGMRVMDLRTGAVKMIPEATQSIRMAFHPTEPKLAWSSYVCPRLRIFDFPTGRSTEITLPGYRGSLYGFAWSPDGKYMAYTAGQVSDFARDNQPPRIRVITADGKRTATLAYGCGGSNLIWLPVSHVR